MTEVFGEDAIVCAESLAVAIEGLGPDLETLAGWTSPAGKVTFDCRSTLAHVVDCLNWYAANLARRSTSRVECPELPIETPPKIMIDCLRSAGSVLASVVRAADPSDRALHPYDISDRSGFAAMGCDEIMVHAWDLGAGLGFEYSPPMGVPMDVVERVLGRLFPWAPEDADPWSALLWANGRQSLGDEPPETEWLWHCAPLSEWNGQIRRRVGGGT